MRGVAGALLLALSGSAVGAVPVALPQEEATVGEVVASIEVVGNRRYTSEQLVKALGVQVGAILDPDAVDRGIRVLFDTYRVRAAVQKRPLETGGIAVRLIVEELAVDLEPRFIGNVNVGKKKLLEWAELREGEELYLFQAPRIASRLTRRYKEEGYHFVEVDVVDRVGGVDEETGEYRAPDVIFEIKEGPKVRVKDIVLTGNESLPDRRHLLLFRRGLKKLAEVKLSSPALFGLLPDAFDQAELERDIIAMREVYRDLGYLDAIVELERLEFSADKSWVTAHVAIDEGGRYTVGSLTLEGVQVLPNSEELQARPLVFEEDELRELLELRVGEVYERRLHQEDASELRKFYGERGYISHITLNDADRWQFLEPVLTFEAEEPIVHVTYRIAQGRKIFIREIPIVGNLHTEDRVIRRLIPIHPGDLADPQEIESARRRIQSTGWFSDRFDLTHREPEYRYRDTDDPNWKDLVFVVNEGQILTFQIAGGVSTNAGAFGTVQLTMDNFDITRMPTSFWTTVEDVSTRQAFHGAGQRLQIRASPGTEVSFFDVSFREPDLFRGHEERISASVNVSRRLRLYRSHNEQRSAASIRVGKNVTPDAAVFAGLSFGSVDVSDLSRGGEPGLATPLTVPADLREQEQRGEIDLAHILLGYRHTSVDNLINRRNGIQFNFENRIYTDFLGSDAEFIQSDLRFDWWNEFDDDPEKISPFYHLQIGAAVGVPIGGSDSVPYSERFFLGGLNTLRGYRFRGVGPNENRFPIGGQTMLHGTMEYRFPIVKQVQPGTYREYESVQGGLFFDWGVLDPDDFEVDLDELRFTVGFLFGITQPLPLTFSFGWPLTDEPGDRERVFAFNVSY